MMFIHNHPSSNTFSFKDLINFLNAEVLKIISVTGNNGNVFILIKNNEYDKTKAISMLNRFVENILSKLASADFGLSDKDRARMTQKAAKDKFLADCDKFGIYYYQENRRQ